MHSVRPRLLLVLLVGLSACPKETLPPALPEERTFSAAVPADLQPSKRERVPLSDVTVDVLVDAEDLMHNSPSPPFRYPHLKRWERERQRTPPSPAPQAPTIPFQQAVFRPEGETRLPPNPSVPPTMPPASVPAPATRGPAQASVPERQEAPDKVIRSANTHSLVTPRRQWITGGIVRYPYQPGQTYLIITAVDHPVAIQLPPGQVASAPLMLDKERFQCIYPDPDIKPYRESIICQGKEPGVTSTTPLLMRSGLAVWLEFRSTDNWGMRGVTWSVPQEALELLETAQTRAPERAPLPGLPQIDYSRRHENYTIEVTKGSPPWVPEKVFDDGTRTFIIFKESLTFGKAPALYTVHSDGTEGVIDWMAYEVPGEPDQRSWYVYGGLWPRAILKGTDGMLVTITRGPTRRTLTQTVPQGRQ